MSDKTVNIDDDGDSCTRALQMFGSLVSDGERKNVCDVTMSLAVINTTSLASPFLSSKKLCLYVGYVTTSSLTPPLFRPLPFLRAYISSGEVPAIKSFLYTAQHHTAVLLDGWMESTSASTEDTPKHTEERKRTTTSSIHIT